MPVREMLGREASSVRRMMQALWPEAGEYDFSDETVFVWDEGEGALGGFISVSIRPWAEGCTTAPVPYIEGWWVAPVLRRRGIGRALMTAVVEWSRAHGYTELGSDAPTDNAVSLTAHRLLGFEPTLRLQFLRKELATDGSRPAI